MEPGFLYILNNAAFPGLLKIGGTARTPEERVRELCTTGVPSRFALIHSERVTDWRAAEKAVHQALASHRYAADREFFLIGARDAIAAVCRAASPYQRGDSAPRRKRASLRCTKCEGSGLCSRCRGSRLVGGEKCPACKFTGICPVCDGTCQLPSQFR